MYSVIDNILYGYAKKQTDALERKIKATQDKLHKKQELLLKYPDMAEYFELEEIEKSAQKERTACTKEQTKQLKMKFIDTI